MRALQLHEGSAGDHRQDHGVRPEGMGGKREHASHLVPEPLGDGAALEVTMLCRPLIEPAEQLGADTGEVRAGRDGHEVLPADALAPGLHAALVVPGGRAGKARLEDVMSCERLEPTRATPRAPVRPRKLSGDGVTLYSGPSRDNPSHVRSLPFNPVSTPCRRNWGSSVRASRGRAHSRPDSH